MHPQRGFGTISGAFGSALSCGVAASIAWSAGQEDVRINMVRAWLIRKDQLLTSTVTSRLMKSSFVPLNVPDTGEIW